ncbi:Complement factor H-related protein 4 [Amphibalanus amphitrite]|uniref:Complement factor H-related protein 4 n=1 Tax=Amphibalanus amphitrite TaxID=1232801 RepID=A0A6A4WW81_AMPAM|nr:Complement factor H-related protein 4 [Amphibalanus amphitrite]
MSPSITTADVAGTSAMATNVTITCRDPSKVIITKDQYQINDYSAQSSSKTFICRAPSQNAMFDDLPVAADAICMTPCPADYTLVAPTEWTVGAITDTVNRLSCLSPVVDRPGLGPYKAAQLCGQRGEQLLDFPVPKDRLNNPSGFSLITAMHYSKDPQDNVMKIRDLRGTFMPSHQFDSGAAPGDYSNGDRCVALYEDPAVDPPGTMVRHSECYNTEHRFVCMKNVGCDAEHFFHEGFCYNLLIASSVKDHMDDCYPDPKNVGGRNGMPAVPTSSLLTALAARPDNPDLPVAVGVYRRHDGFFMMDEPIADTDITISDPAELCAVLDMTAGALTSMACNENTVRPALCQYPGLPQKACTTDDQSGYPANSNFSQAGPHLIHACRFPLQTANFETDQQQTCNHANYLYEGAVIDCDQCMMNPLAPHSDMTLTSDWDSVARTLGTVVNYSCSAGLTTVSGDMVQQQTCTLDGWAGDIVQCDTCEWLPSFNASSGVNISVTGGTQFGGLVEMACLPGLEAADGSVFSSAICTPDAWNLCHTNFSCDFCHGPPLNHTVPAYVSGHDWDGSTRIQGTVVTYTCEGATVTASGLQEQYQNLYRPRLGRRDLRLRRLCRGPDERYGRRQSPVGRHAHGRRGGLVPLRRRHGHSRRRHAAEPDVHHIGLGRNPCIGEPVNVTGMTTITSSFTGDRQIGDQVTYTCQAPLTTSAGQQLQTVNCTDQGWVGDVLPCEASSYHCNHHLYTAEGHNRIQAVCEASGWTVCEPEIECNFCADLGDVSQYGGTLTWDYTGVREVGTVVTLTCGTGLATPELNTTQTLTCGLNGWNRAVPCSVCTDPAPTPPASLEPNVTWTLGDPTAIYTCLESKKFAWGLTTFEMTCSPTGWPCVPECEYCAGSPDPPAGVYPTDVFYNPGGQATYQCSANMQTALNDTVQTLTCVETGWEGDLLPCDVCIGEVTAPSPGQNRIWSGNNTVDTIVTYECVPGMETEEGTTYQTRNCTTDGWTPPPLPCDLCDSAPPPHAYMTRDWSGNRTVNSTATYTCHGNLTTMANETEQTITCTETGWSAPVQPCAMCKDPIPDAGNSTERNMTSRVGWRLPGATVEYLCSTGAVQTVTCTGSGWEPEVLPPCCSAL